MKTSTASMLSLLLLAAGIALLGCVQPSPSDGNPASGGQQLQNSSNAIDNAGAGSPSPDTPPGTAAGANEEVLDQIEKAINEKLSQ